MICSINNNVLKKYFCVVVWICLHDYIDSLCQWPSELLQSTWTDSLKGEITFTDSTMTGWDILIGGDSWDCLLYNETESILIMGTNQTFLLFQVSEYIGYRCLKLEKITDYSIRYYSISPVQQSLAYDRVSIQLSSVNYLDVLDEHICPFEYAAKGSEFSVMVKTGFEEQARVTCPYSILANYNFTYTNTDSTLSCNNGDVGQISMCSNTTQVTLTSPQCSTPPFYSGSDTSICVDVVMIDEDTFISLYNTLGGDTTSQFACVGINAAGSSLSVTPDQCKKNQTSTEIPIDNTPTAIGAVMRLTVNGAPCEHPGAPYQGNVTVSTNGAVTTATFICNPGYTISGSETRVCQSDGSWSGAQTSCACPIPTVLSNGHTLLSSDALTVTYTCDVGYVLLGVQSRTCDTNTNTWSNKDPLCDECQALTSPTNGNFTITSYNDGVTSLVTYTCDTGTTLVGDVTRTCNTNTAWTSTEPTCVSCPNRSPIESGYVDLTTDGLTSIAVYTCASDYTLSGVNVSTCTTQGTWDSNPPSCYCNGPVAPSNGTVMVSIDKSQAVYTCDTWFSLQGTNVRYCGDDGSGWSGTDPVCVGCPVVNHPDNGTVTVTSNGTVTSVTFTCAVGTTLDGATASICQTSGKWTNEAPTCVTCKDAPELSSGSFTLVTNGTSTFGDVTCDVGTTVNGGVIASCDVSGEWTFASGNSSCVSCEALPSTVGGSYSLSSNGTSTFASLACTDGFTLNGSTSVECAADGTWNIQLQGQGCVSITTAPGSNITTTTSASSNDDNGANSLLPAVIALAVVVALLIVVAIVGGLYIRMLKKANESGMTNKENNNMGPSSYMHPSPKAPMDHKHHILGGSLSKSPFQAPTGHQTPSGPWTPRSMRSTVSDGSLNLQLIREESDFDFTPSRNAPWKKTMNNSHSPTTPTLNGNAKHGKGNAPDENENSSSVKTPTVKRQKRAKKKSFGKKIIRLNSVSSIDGGNITDDVNGGSDTDEDNMLHQKGSSNSPSGKQQNTPVPKKVSARSQMSWNAPTNPPVPRLNLSRSERATTPVQHNIETRARDLLHSTPRSGAFASVQ